MLRSSSTGVYIQPITSSSLSSSVISALHTRTTNSYSKVLPVLSLLSLYITAMHESSIRYTLVTSLLTVSTSVHLNNVSVVSFSTSYTSIPSIPFTNILPATLPSTSPNGNPNFRSITFPFSSILNIP